MFVQTRTLFPMQYLIRRPGVSGKFYPAKKDILEREVAVFLESSPEIKIPRRLHGIIVPNDPFIYSGGVAARAYRPLMDQDIERVIILGTSRHTYFEEISFFKGEAYSTPLGEVRVDKELVREITQHHPKLISSSLGHEAEEQGVEVQLPFLQHVLYDFSVVPIIMGNQDNENIEILSDALTRACKKKNVLIVASSNLSSGLSYGKANSEDKAAINYINHFDDEGLNDDFQKGQLEMDGGGAVVAAMRVCRNLGATKSKVLLYRNSGDTGGSKESVSGYVAGLLYE